VSSSPWSKDAPPSAMLPPAGAPAPSWPPPVPASGPGRAGASGPRRRGWVAPALRLLLTVGVSAATAAAVTYIAIRSDHAQVAPQPSVAPGPQFTTAEVAAAKDHLCQVFDLSVRGQEGKGGVRIEGGDVNTPMVMRAMNSVSAVENALAPAVPSEVVSAARKYISATLDQTTAAMGSTPTREVNRLTDVRNDTIFALVDVCGLPR